MKPGAGWFSHPVLSLLLAAAWLLLQRSLAPAQLLTAALLALLVPRLVHGFLGPGVRLRAVGTALRLAGVVLWDILVSNLVVARLVLDPSARPRPAWVPVPLALTHPTALSLLASIVTTTPGTVSCVVDEERREILVHALDCADPGALVADIQRRYEAPLREIFE
ncbi:MAG: Na+/H+ antiporter subunit E [Piscinibacter sp.]|uniref:Na+/H+ antiporter subunit E n=1 Tax=Piscinibacter sp. TaxID=1903157 RepID=UPI0025865DF5|nr:Na+/H+ antiporter subunit E [Piscinibacter sp.]MCW5663057.1 Na+/H+ antiporter subunit E [Piscinibacter sp.]